MLVNTLTNVIKVFLRFKKHGAEILKRWWKIT